MSNRTIVELNHDYCPRDEDAEQFGRQLQMYMRSGDQKFLPDGIRFLHFRHHSQPSPMERKKGSTHGRHK